MLRIEFRAGRWLSHGSAISLVAAGILAASGCAKDGSEDNEPMDESGGAQTETGDDDDDGQAEFGSDGAESTGAEETGPDAETGADESTGGGGGGFIGQPDGGGASNECDVWAQDCPSGEKCMPWANDGGNSWNATRCSPVSDSPGQHGDSCTVEGSGVSGIDSCDLGVMCWDVDPEDNTGTCVAMCGGSPDNPLCDDPMTGCSSSNEGVLNLCLPFCDPLVQDCPEGNACYPELAGFFCSPDASGAAAGEYGSPCEYLNGCDEGFWCANAEGVAGCTGSSGCCAAFCDITDENATCPGEGEECTPAYAEGEAPPGYEAVGFCLIPA